MLEVSIEPLWNGNLLIPLYSYQLLMSLNRTIVEWKSEELAPAETEEPGLNRTIVEWKLERGTEARSLKPEVWV